MNLLITGASGFIGTALVQHLKSRGHQITRLVREKNRRSRDTIYWNPVNEEIEKDDFEGFDGVVHLAGENIFGLRWTRAKKEAIFLSRVRQTWLLAHTLSRLKRPPKVFFSASAIGYYGDRGDEILTEESSKGTGFLSDVCQKWEEASQVLEGKKTRVVRGRFGVVISPDGGMLRKILPMFRCGLGGRIGSGQQWMSWIALADLVRAIEFAVSDNNVNGTCNFVAPEPVTNSAFTKAIARLVRRRQFLPVPAWVIRLALGEMGNTLLLSSTRAVPDKLIKAGFSYRFKALSSLCVDWQQ